MRNIKAFISYKWETEEHNFWIEKFATDLRKNGIDAKLDKWNVKLGQDFVSYMTRQIMDADVLLLVITPELIQTIDEGKNSKALDYELRLAMSRYIDRDEKFRIIGILKEGNSVPKSLANTRYLSFKNPNSYKLNLIELLKDLNDFNVAPIIEPIKEDLILEDVANRLFLSTPHSPMILGTNINEKHQLIIKNKLLSKYEKSKREYKFKVYATELNNERKQNFIEKKRCLYSNEQENEDKIEIDEIHIVCINEYPTEENLIKLSRLRMLSYELFEFKTSFIILMRYGHSDVRTNKFSSLIYTQCQTLDLNREIRSWNVNEN